MSKRSGEMLATQAAIRALIKLFPDQNEATLAAQRALDSLIGQALHSSVDDETIAGIEQARQRIVL